MYLGICKSFNSIKNYVVCKSQIRKSPNRQKIYGPHIAKRKISTLADICGPPTIGNFP